MDDLGSIQVRPGVLFPIIDCRKWRVMHGEPQCSESRDLASCASCPHRVSREGNINDPPVLGEGRTTPPKRAKAPAEPSDGKWRGLGDVVASATKAVGISPCGGCQQRREALNRLVPFKGVNDDTAKNETTPDGSDPSGVAGGKDVVA